MDKLDGLKILVTSGPTRGPIDAVRYVTNRSSGRLGALIAQEALQEGAEVTFIYGRDSISPAVAAKDAMRLRLIAVETVADLIAAVKEAMWNEKFDAIIHSMAVLDFEPEKTILEKVPSDREEWVVKLVRTPKVIKLIRELAPDAVLVGFKLEVGSTPEELVKVAYRSLRDNRADFVLANDLTDIEQGRHTGYLVNPQGEVEKVMVGKQEIAKGLVASVKEALAVKARGGRKDG